MSGALTIRPAVEDDLDALRALMTLAIERGQAAVLTPAQGRREPRRDGAGYAIGA